MLFAGPLPLIPKKLPTCQSESKIVGVKACRSLPHPQFFAIKERPNKPKCSLSSTGKSSMAGYETQSLINFAKRGPPWVYIGRALYQIHLVKTEVARLFIPEELELVEAFGYTLGGFYLAQYEDSPVGKFDELAVLAGLVRSNPESAWAAKVIMNNEETCWHGRKVFGLPSNVGILSKEKSVKKEKFTGMISNFLKMIGISTNDEKKQIVVRISEINNSNITSLCSINIPFCSNPNMNADSIWMGPKIIMPLPNISGRTVYNARLLKYTMEMKSRLRVVIPAKVLGPCISENALIEDNKLKQCISIMLSKPVLALEFNSLSMHVKAPTKVKDSTLL